MSSANPIKRIVIMGNDVDRLGGIGRFMNRMSIEFFQRGYQVELVGIAPPPAGHRQTMARPADIKVRTLMSRPVPQDWALHTVSHKINPARQLRRLRRMELRSEAVGKLRSLLSIWGEETLIICTQVYGMEHMLEAGYDPTLKGMPRVIGQFHGSVKMAKNMGSFRRVLNSYANVDRFLCLSAQDAEDFRRAGLNNCGWLPNPVVVSPTPAVERKKTFVSLARYDEEKSLHHFLNAWNHIAADLPDWSVELYGEGVKREDLHQLIERDNIPRARLMGKTDSVETVLASSRIHVLSSQEEGLPISIVEAQMFGVPTVAFDCAPGVSDLITSGTDGFVVGLNDVRALAERMKQLALDTRQWDQFSAASLHSSSRFVPERIMELWDREIAELTL